MNGFSLLVVLASLGVDPGWETSPDGQLRYTIKINREDLDALRGAGQRKQAHATEVPTGSRNLRLFQVLVNGTSEVTSATNRRSVSDDGVAYGWEPSRLGQGGVDFLVQVSPERFESLVLGRPIRGMTPIEVSDIRQMIVYIGNATELTKQLPAATGVAAPEAPNLLGNRDGLANSSDPRSQNSVAAPGNVSSHFNASTNPRQPPLDPPQLNQSGTALSQGSGPTTDADWRRKGGRYSRDDFAPQTPRYPQDDRRQYGAQVPHSNPSFDPVDRTAQGQRLADQRYPDPQSQDPWYDVPAAGNRQFATTYGNSQIPSPSNRNFASQPPGQQQQGPVFTGLQTQAPAQQQPVQQQPVQQQPVVQQPVQVVQQPVQQQPVLHTVAPAVSTTAAAITPIGAQASSVPAEDAVRPWGPLILTTMALFTSLGANAYLGWLAWSFFWRFKDVASDVVRARNQAA